MQYMIIDENGYGDQIFYGTYEECENQVDILCSETGESSDYYNIVKNKYGINFEKYNFNTFVYKHICIFQ